MKKISIEGKERSVKTKAKAVMKGENSKAKKWRKWEKQYNPLIYERNV